MQQTLYRRDLAPEKTRRPTTPKSHSRRIFSGHIVNYLTNFPVEVGRRNQVAAWWLLGMGLSVGAVLGLWSFYGPIAPPRMLAEYEDIPRRLLRLAHIALVALPILNLQYVPWIRQSRWSRRFQRMACDALLVGTMGLPIVLAAAAFWPAALFVSPVPVGCLITAVFALALGLSTRPGRIQ